METETRTSSKAVKAGNYVTCVCGKVCKGRAAHANHGRKCPTERERSSDFIAVITDHQPGADRDAAWAAYGEKWGGR